MDKLLKAVDLARALGVSRSVVYLWIDKGLPYLEAPGVGRRFQIDKVKDWLNQFETIKTSKIDSKAVSCSEKVQTHGDILKGVYGKPGGVVMISYPIPDGDKTRRVRESSGSIDLMKAAAIRKERLRAAWVDAPDSLNREKYLKEAETD